MILRSLLLIFFVLLTNLKSLVLTEPQVPCLFIFGDSLLDNGNNNNLRTRMKVNYPPYGIDFPQGPTGRFTNGQNLADFIAYFLKFNRPIPPYAYVRDRDIMRGVNYASGSSGILGQTGRHAGDNIYLGKQLVRHEWITSRMAKIVGNRSAAINHLSKCLYYFNVGSNDYINNYFLPEYYNTSNLYTPGEYATALVWQYSRQLDVLYRLGARKLVLSGLSSLGCIPVMTSRSPNSSKCVDSMNEIVELFNRHLWLLVSELNEEYTDTEYGVVMGASADSVVNPSGIRHLTTPCCKVSGNTGLCMAGQAPCVLRGSRLFFDDYHPTEFIYRLWGAAVYAQIQVLLNLE